MESLSQNFCCITVLCIIFYQSAESRSFVTSYQDWFPMQGQQGGMMNGFWPISQTSFGNNFGGGMWNQDPCRSVNCGPLRYCQPLRQASVYGGASYRCVRQRNFYGSSTLFNPNRVGKCFDELVYKVPVGSLNDGRTRGGFNGNVGNFACIDECQSGRECMSGQMCCNSGCKNICYTPETTVVDGSNNGGGWNGGIGQWRL